MFDWLSLTAHTGTGLTASVSDQISSTTFLRISHALVLDYNSSHFYCQPTLPPSFQRVDAMSSRLKSLGFGSKRKSNASLPSTAVSGTPTAPGSASAQTPNGSTSAANTPPPVTANASQTSLAPAGMNQPGRPPSYQHSSIAGRPQSPMPPQQGSHYPPPIDTSRGYVGANPQMAQQPPGYGGAGYGQMQQQPPQMQYGQHIRPAEVEGANRNKAQLIVGIDFVRLPTRSTRDHL